MSINFLRKGGANTSDATATADDILSPKTAYVNGNKIVGNILPTYENVDATEYLSTNLNFSTSDKYSKLLQLGSYVFYMGYDSNTGNINLISINGNKAESKQSFTVKELFNNTSVGEILLSYDSYTDNEEYTLCPGIGYNNGGGTTFVYFRRIKYNVKSRKFEIIDGIASSSWEDTGNNYGYYADTSSILPNRFLVQYSNWKDWMTLSYEKIIWSDNSGAISTLAKAYRSDSYRYGIEETGNGYMFTSNGRLYILNENETSFISWSENVNYKIYISHNCKYMIYNNSLYSFSMSNDANAIFNSKKLIQEGLPSYTNIYFSKDDTYAILVDTNIINIIKFDNTGYTLIQSINTNSKVFTFDSTMFLNLFSDSWHKYEYTSGKELISLSIKGQSLIKAKASNVPLAEQVLKDKTFIGLNGVTKGTMPNNGELIFEPSDIEQIIPAGYTKGGKVLVADFEKTKEYNDCIDYANAIINHSDIPYKQLQYLQTTGKECINTGINASSDVDLEIKFKSLIATPGAYGRIIGTNKDMNFELCDTNSTSNYRVSVNSGKYTERMQINNNDFNIFKMTGSGEIYLNGEQKYNFNANPVNSNIQLFSINGESGNTLQVVYCKIYKNNEIIRDFVPVKTSNNVLGLYDKITNELFTNTGTGDFIGGAEI